MTRISSKNADQLRDRLIGHLLASDETAMALARILQTCSKKIPCGSAACPACRLGFQRMAVKIVDRFILGPSWSCRGRIHSVTIAPPIGCCASDELSTEVFEQVRRRIELALEKVKWSPIIFGLEASFNEDPTGELESHWCVHAHGVGLDWVSKKQRTQLRETFKDSRFVKRPVQYKPLDQDVRGRLYPFKPEHFRKVLRPPDPPRKRELRTLQAVEAAIVHHRLGPSRRLLMHGIERQRIRDVCDEFNWI